MLLLTGPPGAGKTEFLLQQLRDAVRTGRRDFRFVVPTATMVQHVRNQMAREGLLIRADSIITFSKLIGELAPDIRIVPDELFALLVEGAVKRIDAKEFAGVMQLPGFHASLAAGIANFDSAGSTAARLRGALPSPALAPYARAFAAVWNDVEISMKASAVTMRGGVLQAAALRMNETPPTARTLWFDGFAVFSEPELAVIGALAEHTDITVTLPVEAASEETHRRLSQMGFTAKSLTPANARSPKISAFKADSPEREADEIARRILSEADAGRPFRDIGIVLRQPESLAPLLCATLERYGIPVRAYGSTALAEHPAALFFTALLEAMLSGWDHERTVAALRLSPRAGSSGALDRLDIKMRENLPNRGIDSLLALAYPDDAAARLLRGFQDLNSWRELRRTPAQWAEKLQTLRTLFQPRAIPDELTPAHIEMYRSQARALDEIDAVCNSAADPMIRAGAPSRSIPLAEFWPDVKAILRMARLRTLDRRRNVVHILSAYEARQWDLAVVFIPGLVEKEFPKHHPQNAFFPDEALQALRSYKILVRTAADLDAEEQSLFESACGRATDSLVLSYAVSGVRGDQPLPSPFFTAAVADLAVEDSKAVRPQLSQRRDARYHSVEIRDAELLPVLNERHPKFSPSALESYLQCPFQFFANKTLKLREFPPRPEDRMDFLLMGNIVHEILKEWFPARQELAPLIQAVFERFCAEKNVPLGFNVEVKRHELVHALTKFEVLHDWPRAVSVQTELPCSFTLDRDIQISGRLDRVETYPGEVGVVMDYKYSRASTTKSKTTDDTKVQGPLYLLALEKQFNLRASAMIYCSVKEEAKLFGWGEVPGLNTKQADKLLELTSIWREHAIDEVRRAVAEIRSGVIHARPASTEPCRYCNFKDACRYTATVAAARAASEG